MLRIHFSGDDLARTRIAPSVDPMWELVLAVHMLRGQRGDLLFTDWRRNTAAALRRSPMSRQIRLLATLTPTFGYFPDFLTPSGASPGFGHGLEAVLSTPASTLARDLRRLSAPSSAHPLLRRLADGEREMLTALGEGMRAFYEAAVVPCRRGLSAAVERDRGARIDAMAAGGVEGLLKSLQPTVTWSGGELAIPGHPEQEILLGGRGLLLVPSYFCVNHPVTLFDTSLSPVLIYPVARTTATALPSNPGLPALIGRTRAAVLESVGTGCGTTELARRIGVSPASSSEHMTALRDAGLIMSRRDGQRMLHQLTRLGRALLEGG